jgi:hypothetical protein
MREPLDYNCSPSYVQCLLSLKPISLESYTSPNYYSIHKRNVATDGVYLGHVGVHENRETIFGFHKM